MKHRFFRRWAFLIFGIGSFALFPASGYPAVRNPYCRFLLETAINPFSLVGKAQRELKSRDVDSYFSLARYEESLARIRDHAEEIPRDPEGKFYRDFDHFLAELDTHLNSIGFPQTTASRIGNGRSVERVGFLKRADEILWKANGPDEASIDELTFLFYAIDRHLPYQSVEILTRGPLGVRRGIIDTEMRRLILKHALLEVLNRFGLPEIAMRPTFVGRMKRAIGLSWAIASKFIQGGDGATGLTRLSQRNVVYRDVLTLGYEKAVEKWRPVIAAEIGAKANFEVFLAISGAALSVITTYEIAAEWLREPPPEAGKLPEKSSAATNEIPEAELRKTMVAKWEKMQREDYGFTVIPPEDLEFTRHFYDTLNVNDLRRRYDQVLAEERADAR